MSRTIRPIGIETDPNLHGPPDTKVSKPGEAESLQDSTTEASPWQRTYKPANERASLPGRGLEAESVVRKFSPAWAPGRPMDRSVRQRLWTEVAREFPTIEVDIGVLNGEPVLRGTRIPVSIVLSLASDSFSLSDIVEEFDREITVEQVKQAMLYAAALVR